MHVTTVKPMLSMHLWKGYGEYENKFYLRMLNCTSRGTGFPTLVDRECHKRCCMLKNALQTQVWCCTGWKWLNGSSWLGNPYEEDGLIATNNLDEIKRRTDPDENEWFQGLWEHDYTMILHACLIHRKPDILEYLLDEVFMKLSHIQLFLQPIP